MTKITHYMNDFTGELFDSEEECVKSELEASGLKMYSSEGETTDVNNAVIVILKTSKATEYFLTLCERQAGTSETAKGISRYSVGTYVWSYSEQRYFNLTPVALDAFKYII